MTLRIEIMALAMAFVLTTGQTGSCENPQTATVASNDAPAAVMASSMARLDAAMTEIEINKNNYETWKNIPLAKEVLTILKDQVPLRVEGKITPYGKIVIIDKAISSIPQRSVARFCLEARNFQLSMFGKIEDQDAAIDMKIDEYEGDAAAFVRKVDAGAVAKQALKWDDFTSGKLSMKQWCSKYNVNLKFDPVEMTPEYEAAIYDVEAQCAEALASEERVMGFCYRYWAQKKAALAERGINWRTPSEMNPKVIFD